MLVRYAKDVARQWVIEEVANVTGFQGAFYHGSINWLADDAVMPATSDVDVMIVLQEGSGSGPGRRGKLIFRDVLLEVSYIGSDAIRSPEQVLGVSHLAGSFRGASIMLDPTGHLAELQAVVAEEYAKRKWVHKRCEHAKAKVLGHLRSLNEWELFHDQVTSWLFGTGVTTHMLLVAGLRNPTVRKRYVAVRELLEDYGHLGLYNTLLELLGCARMGPERVAYHLEALTEVFDAAKRVIRTPLVFAADISDIGRSVAIDGSRELIERGFHREAIFWMAVTYSRCQKVLYQDAPAEVQDRFSPGYRQLLSDLGITSLADLAQRSEEVQAFLPRIWEIAEDIMRANPEIED